jgi:beta-lactam-binding protein with PASTA domain
VDATATAGTVLETQPAVGSFVVSGSHVTLVVAVAPPPSVPASVPPSGG